MKKLTKREEKAFTRYLFQQDFIEEGSGRKVYGWRAWVIKVAKNRNGYLQNKLEVERFRKYGSTNLAKIIAYSKKIVIMEKVDLDISKIEPKKSMKLTTWLDKICGIDSLDHSDSQGVRKNGDIVAYDYGDSKKTYSKKLCWDLSFRELLATKANNDKEKDNGNY